jgi:hypothetical protein
VDETLGNEWVLWALVENGMASLDELETTWLYDDVMRAVAYLLAKNDMAARAVKK